MVQVVANLLHTRYDEVRLVTAKSDGGTLAQHGEGANTVDVQLIQVDGNNVNYSDGDGLEERLVQAVWQHHWRYMEQGGASFMCEPLRVETAAAVQHLARRFARPWAVALAAFGALGLLALLGRSKTVTGR